jgi:hypothetical protein
MHRAFDIGAHPIELSGRTGFATRSGLAAWSFLAVHRLTDLREALGKHPFHRAAELSGGGPQLGNGRQALGLNRTELLFPFVISGAQNLP